MYGRIIADSLDFSEALRAVQAGFRIAREGWNGKDQWICMVEGCEDVPAREIDIQHHREFAERNGGVVSLASTLTLKNAQNEFVMGWTPSSGDLFATDWIAISDKNSCDCPNCRAEENEPEEDQPKSPFEFEEKVIDGRKVQVASLRIPKQIGQILESILKDMTKDIEKMEESRKAKTEK